MPEKTLATSIHHVAVVVRNVPEAKAFYQSVFGFPQIERLTARVSSHGGAWFQVGNLELHLQERPGDGPKTEQHFALITEDFETVLERVKKFGGKVEEGKLIEGFSKRCFVYDIDGNRIELLQR